MSLINAAYRFYNRTLLKELDRSFEDPFSFQEDIFKHLIARGKHTAFGKEHRLEEIHTIRDFQQCVPMRDYNAMEPYIKQMLRGTKNVLWDKPTTWFALSSGTSAARSKFIPMNKENLKECHYKSMLTMLSHYVRTYPQSRIFQGKSLVLGGSRQFDKDVETQCSYGDLSAFLTLNTPAPARLFTTPPRKIGLIPHFETKTDIVSRMAVRQNVVSFSGVPSWNLLLMRKILEISGKDNLSDVWPNMELFMHGGVSFEPYRVHFQKIFPSPNMRYMETYNASEGFFAFQTDLSDPGMFLLPNVRVFYEFVPLEKWEAAENGTYTDFLTLDQVTTDKPYALVISTNSGLWRYSIGDTIRFTQLYPHKLVITGRTQLFINTFGEELMIENAEKALAQTCQQTGATVFEYTVAPVFMGDKEKGAHQWLIEFESLPSDLEHFVSVLDKQLMQANSDYHAKRLDTGAMGPPQLVVMKKNSFYKWMAQNNRLGGQNKVPRLWSDRKYAEGLLKINESI